MSTSSEPLFPANLISSEVAASLPQSYTVRPLERADYKRGFLECLADLTWIGEYNESEFYERYDWLATSGKGWYYCVVIDDGTKIVATATMILERKFIHNRNMVGHIEEVVVSKDQQGKGLGLKVIQAINSVAESLGCKKLILSCSPSNIEFYEKCGYEKAGQEMSRGSRQQE